MVIGASDCHLNVGEVFVHQFHVLLVGYDFRLGDDEIAHALAVQFLDGAIRCPCRALKRLEAVGHATQTNDVARLEVAPYGAVYLLNVHDGGLRCVPQLAEVQEALGIAVLAVVLTPTAVGVESCGIVALVALITSHGLEE